MKKQAKTSIEPIVAAHFDVESGIALVSQDDLKWLASCPDVVARKGNPWKLNVNGVAHGFEVIPVKASVIANTTPKTGACRRWRHARCGGGEAKLEIGCFPLSSGRYSKVELAGYSVCIRGEVDEFCDETYVKIGDITIAWDSACRLVAQRHPQYRWVGLP